MRQLGEAKVDVAEAQKAVGLAESIPDVLVDRQGLLVALASLRQLGEAQVHVAEALKAVGAEVSVATSTLQGRRRNGQTVAGKPRPGPNVPGRYQQARSQIARAHGHTVQVVQHRGQVRRLGSVVGQRVPPSVLPNRFVQCFGTREPVQRGSAHQLVARVGRHVA